MPNPVRPRPAPIPAPAPSSKLAADIEQFQKLFLANGYDKQLTESILNPDQTKSPRPLTPLWDKARQRNAPPTPCTYIPLAHTVTMLGVQDYLLVAQTTKGLDFRVATYLYDKPKANELSPDAPNFFTTFTGTILIKRLATGETARTMYQNGASTQPSASPTDKGARTQDANGYICANYTTCYYTGYNGSSTTYGSMTTSTNPSCSPPGYDSPNGYNGTITWTLTSSSTNYECHYEEGAYDSPPPTPPSGGSNGGGDNDGAVSNASAEYVNPNNTYTAAPPPPDVTEYNCAELRKRHPDDTQQHGNVGDIDLFVHDNQGYDRNAVTSQRGYQHIAPGIDMSMGPTMRYIQDPLNPDVVIDLRHMLTVGYYGPGFGNSVEVIEGLGGHLGSYDHQDYFSNQLGYDFYNNYYPQIETNPNYFAYYLSDYLKNASLRTHDTDPGAINLRCP